MFAEAVSALLSATRREYILERHIYSRESLMENLFKTNTNIIKPFSLVSTVLSLHFLVNVVLSARNVAVSSLYS